MESRRCSVGDAACRSDITPPLESEGVPSCAPTALCLPLFWHSSPSLPFTHLDLSHSTCELFLSGADAPAACYARDAGLLMSCVLDMVERDYDMQVTHRLRLPLRVWVEQRLQK
jgi:hypothetical protein